jgi:protein-S-isoprenylcysteine O-methyltransferase Ste14
MFVLVAAMFHGLLLMVPFAFAGAGWHSRADTPVVLFLIVVVSHGICEGIASERCGDATLLRQDRSTQDRFLSWATALSLLVVSWVSLATHIPVGVPTLEIVLLWPLVGLTAMTLGIALRCLAMFTLGPGFVSALSVQPGQALVQSGIYRYLRHPSESGLICIAFGVPLLLESTAGLVIAVATVAPLSWYRTRREEAALHAAYGVGYEGYAAAAGRYFPRLKAIANTTPRVR